MLTQYFFRNNIDDNPPPLKEKSSWISSPCDNPTLIKFFMRKTSYPSTPHVEKPTLT